VGQRIEGAAEKPIGLRRRVGNLKALLRRELRLARHVLLDMGPKLLAARLMPSRNDLACVPRQRVLSWSTTLNSAGSPDELRTQLTARSIRFVEGRHTIYVPPQARLADNLGEFVGRYPDGAGFKIVKRFAPPATARYLIDSDSRWITRSVVGGVDRQADAANALYILGIGPRLYDVAELVAGRTRITCFVVEHVVGIKPTDDDHAVFIEKVRQILYGNLRHAIGLMASGQLASKDFNRPTCNGNLIKRAVDGQVYYVDFQSFVVIDRAAVLRAVLEAAQAAPGLLNEGSPTTGCPSLDIRRGVLDGEARWQRYSDILSRGNISLAGRVVFDAGMGGMTLGHALAAGAGYGVSWTSPSEARTAEALHCMAGNTRIVFIPGGLDDRRPFAADIPDWLRGAARDAILFFRGHASLMRLPDTLGCIPWKALMFEAWPDASSDEYACVVRAIEQRWQCRLVETSPPSAGRDGCPSISLFLRG
jgi:hypothetical protein